MRVVLASASPRRREILTQAGIPFTVCPAHGAENAPDAPPDEVVKALAAQKAREVAAVTDGPAAVIGADTVVFAGGRILGKPADADAAREMLRLLSGRVHTVYTGVCVVIADEKGRRELSFCEATEVEVCRLTEREIDDYVATGEPFDKAGGYAVQGRFARFVRAVRGDYCNVVGLPLCRLCAELKKADVAL